MQIQPGEKVAIVGSAGSGAEALAEAFGGLIWPESGRITAGNRDLLELPEAVTGRRMAYASSDAYLFQGTLRDNLLYGLKHAPLTEVRYDGAQRSAAPLEHRRSPQGRQPRFRPRQRLDRLCAPPAPPGRATSIMPSAPCWTPSSFRRTFSTSACVRASIRASTPRSPAASSKCARRFAQRLDSEGLSGLVASFEPGAYNTQATVGENLLFGAATGPELTGKELAGNAYFRSVLRQDGLGEALYKMGLEIAGNAIELFADLPPDHPFFQQLAFMTAEDIPEYQQLLQRLRGKPIDAASYEDRTKIIKLSFAYIEPRHRFGLLTPELMDKIVAARHRFYEGLPAELQGAIERYDPQKYTTAATLSDNVLFGRIAHNQPDGPERIRIAGARTSRHARPL